MADTVKPTSAEAVTWLRELGLRPVLLAGDNTITARAVAAQVGIDEVLAEVLPGDKAEAVARLQAAGRWRRWSATASTTPGIPGHWLDESMPGRTFALWLGGRVTQFRESMIGDKARVATRPGLAIAWNADGFGVRYQ